MTSRPAVAPAVVAVLGMLGLMAHPGSAWELDDVPGYALHDTAPEMCSASICGGQQLRRDSLRYEAGRLAWIERPWNTTADGKVVVDAASPAVGAQPAEIVDLSATHAAWKFLGNYTGQPAFVGDEVYGMDLTGRHAVKLGGNATGRLSTPHVHGALVAWGWTPEAATNTHTVHRADLATGLVESWPRPRPVADFHPHCSFDAWPYEADLLLYYDPGCSRDHFGGGLYRWTPSSGELRLLTNQTTPDLVFDGDRIAWTGTGGGAGSWNIWLMNLTTGETGPATAVPEGRAFGPQLSGDLVVWSDFRSGATQQYSENAVRMLPTFYFKNLRTDNEYMLGETFDASAGPALEGRTLVYNDANGYLRFKQLPSDAEVLTVAVEPELLPGTGLLQLGDTAGDILRLVLDPLPVEPDGPLPDVEVAWDQNLDGVFETLGALELPLNTSGLPDLKEVLGRVLEKGTKRHAVVSVDTEDQTERAKDPANPPTPSGDRRFSPPPAANQEETLFSDANMGWFILGGCFVVAAAILVGAFVARGRRPPSP